MWVLSLDLGTGLSGDGFLLFRISVVAPYIGFILQFLQVFIKKQKRSLLGPFWWPSMQRMGRGAATTFPSDIWAEVQERINELGHPQRLSQDFLSSTCKRQILRRTVDLRFEINLLAHRVGVQTVIQILSQSALALEYMLLTLVPHEDRASALELILSKK
ncbi:hypothetical protein AXG93_163s1150 [Marchantia polymorpha subsp. ruderalis]|uniref:Uncharacterized protein n=1 Tax=Marchantia polymorpha subsp. ruderalis TaxID=1480154 RepID=A0A176VD74_MARPO|nr:hypothetical protein AXG93_163s1150 [Marchantia polymorpha subsp. ruderalis]